MSLFVLKLIIYSILLLLFTSLNDLIKPLLSFGSILFNFFIIFVENLLLNQSTFSNPYFLMKAIVTLAVLGLAFASEHKENPRFRINHRVINAGNNSGVKIGDFNKDFQNTNNAQGATEEDWMKYVPREFRGLVNAGTDDSKVFTASNNTGTVIIRRDDADDEFGLIDINTKITNIDANHNSGMMKILNHDEADDEFTVTSPFHTSPDVVYRDDEDNVLAAWKILETYTQSNQQLGPHTVHTTTKTQTFNASNNNRGVIIRDDTDNELGLINIHHEIININANHNGGMITILDDADDELAVLGSLLRKDWAH